jgi:hypothetical protein
VNTDAVKAPAPVCFFESYIKPDPAAMEYYSARFTGNFEKIDRYCLNASVLNAVQDLLVRRSADRNSRNKPGRKDAGLFTSVVSDLKILSELKTADGSPKYPHTLPLSARNLRPLLKAYREQGYGALIHGNENNDHARIVTADMELLFLSIYIMDNKPYAAWVHADYLDFMHGKKHIVNYGTGELLAPANYRDEKEDIVAVSESTIWYYINKPSNRIIIDKFRSNGHTFRHKHLPHYVRKSPQYSLSKVSFDDRDLPRPLSDGGHVYAYYAYDVMSGMLIGAAHSLKKDENLFLSCLRNMYHNLSDWGMGWPLEGEFENHLCGKYKDTILKPGNLFKYVTFCAPSNSQEKRAEHFNRIKKYGTEKRSQNNIGRHYARLEANRTEGDRYYNEEKDKYEYKYKTCTYAQLVADDMQAIEEYNSSLHRDRNRYAGQSIREAFFARVNPDMLPMDSQRVFYYLGERQQTAIARNQYISLQYAKYWISAPDALELLQPNNYSVEACWMRDREGVAMSEAYIYQGGRFISGVCRLKAFNEAKAEWTEADTLAKRAQDAYIGSMKECVSAGSKRLMRVGFWEDAATDDRGDNYVVAAIPVDGSGECQAANEEEDEEYYLEDAKRKAYAF